MTIISDETISAIEDYERDEERFQAQVETRKAQHGEYLGDGVYAHFDGYQVWLETGDGLGFYNPIALDRHVFEALKRYASRFYGPK